MRAPVVLTQYVSVIESAFTGIVRVEVVDAFYYALGTGSNPSVRFLGMGSLGGAVHNSGGFLC